MSQDIKEKIKEIKDSLEEEDIIRLVCEGLGSGEPKYDSSGNLIFQTVDHNDAGEGSYKLYYYSESKTFVSYTGDGAMDIFELVKRSKGYDSFFSAYQYVCKFFGFSKVEEYRGFNYDTETEFTSDWDILNKLSDYQMPENKENAETTILNSNLIEYFPIFYPIEWLKEGYSEETLDIFNIRIDPCGQKIIIPHYDINNNLIGIRGRSFDKLDLDKGMKYSPVWIEEECYRHPLNKHLYGLNICKEAIKKSKKVCIVEAEKSVLKSYQWYKDNSFTVATCGCSGLSEEQISLLMQLGVNQIIIAYDKENFISENVDTTQSYEEKILRLFQPLTSYFDIYVLFDYTGVLNPKDSPFDHGKEVLEFLMDNKFKIAPIDETLLKNKESR